MIFPLIQGSFLLIDESVGQKFPTHSSIDFLSRTALFRCNMKWARKAFRVAITDSPVFKKSFDCKCRVSTIPRDDHNWSIWKNIVRHLREGSTITTYQNSFAPHMLEFKMGDIYKCSMEIYMKLWNEQNIILSWNLQKCFAHFFIE